MKYIIILLFTINTAFSIDCGTETISEVNKCSVDDRIASMIPITCSWNEELEEKDRTYSTLICDPVMALSDFEAQLQEWKDVNIARITETLRLQDLKDRLIAIGVKFGKYKSVTGLRDFMIECGYEHPNPAIWVEEVYGINNIAFITCLESKKSVLDTKKEKEDKDKEKKDDAEALAKTYSCESIINPELEYLKILCETKKAH